MVWNPFAVRSVEEATDRLQRGVLETKRSCLEAPESDPAWVEQVFSVIGSLPEGNVRLGRGVKVPRWYSRMTHINLPDELPPEVDPCIRGQLRVARGDGEPARTTILSRIPCPLWGRRPACRARGQHSLPPLS